MRPGKYQIVPLVPSVASPHPGFHRRKRIAAQAFAAVVTEKQKLSFKPDPWRVNYTGFLPANRLGNTQLVGH